MYPGGFFMSLISARDLVKTYQTGEIEVQAIRGVDFDIEAGSFVSFVGPSGSGKTTLLNMIGCLDIPTAGDLTVSDTDVSELDRYSSARFRGENIGFIFQDFNLIPVLTVFENVEYPLMMVQNRPAPERREKVGHLLEAVGMSEMMDKFPDQLSGGQKQRVAVARALVAEPKLVLADEPTANLDHATAMNVLTLMKGMRDRSGTTFIFSTHDPKVMAEAEVTFTLEDGALVNGQPRGGNHG
jgi:putative ABC transport system ATP-binding protein